ncbi:hypothetical protein SAMN05428975_3137 [Mucilaginibacter sp. OK268]|uniref:hypothetical protein n=1 Tax=Mucilaginibacter sp. OK268 TaxID=1881048 RepID=UPI000884CF06|nr:hypothetical protein [Mucilaginibacter sp. OK268]SDP86522.1 hypothetical protein SAMN05428975_3137 [Mucilaginibacter sp. OK268]
MEDIKKFIEHLECPIVDGIIFPDKRIQLLEVEVLWQRPYEYSIKPSFFTSIDDLEAEGKLWTGHCGVLDKCVDILNGIKVICGESSLGGDGFIAVLDMQTERVIWIAFFTCSNPFDKVTVEEGQIVAVSTLNCVWKLNIANPVEIVVTC